MLMSAVNELLVFKPVNIFNPDSEPSEKAVNLPFFWTFSTSIFVETNIAFLVIHLLLVNYIMLKNRTSLEQIWRRKDFFVMVVVSGFMATCT